MHLTRNELAFTLILTGPGLGFASCLVPSMPTAYLAAGWVAFWLGFAALHYPE